MDPYAKALRISVALHTTVALGLVFAALWSQLFAPRPAAVFTLLAPPAGLIAGGPSSTQAAEAPADIIPLPQGPKLPSPAPAEVAKPKPAKMTPAETFAPAPPKPKVARKSSASGILPKQKATPKPEKISYSDFQKKYAPKAAPTKSKAKPTPQSAAPVGGPSFEENLASRLNRRMQEEGNRTVGTGLGGVAGSGIAGAGIPGAIDDPEAIYTGTLYTYLNSVWEEPREVGNVRLFARVEFVVNREGTITSWRITRRSGSESFDKSVERVFARVKQVTAPPIAQDYRLSVTFETRDS